MEQVLVVSLLHLDWREDLTALGFLIWPSADGLVKRLLLGMDQWTRKMLNLKQNPSFSYYCA